MLKVAKSLLALYWLLVLVNLFRPFTGPYMNWIALTMLVVHLLEIVLLHSRLQRQAEPWKDRLLVLLFGVLHVRGMRNA